LKGKVMLCHRQQ